MSGLDKYRIVAACVMLVMGIVIVVKYVPAGAFSPAVVGILLIALGAYRLNQYRNYLRASRGQ